MKTPRPTLISYRAGRRLYIWRSAHEKSAKKMGEDIGVSPSQIRWMEEGKRWSVELLDRVSRVMGVDPGELISPLPEESYIAGTLGGVIVEMGDSLLRLSQCMQRLKEINDMH